MWDDVLQEVRNRVDVLPVFLNADDDLNLSGQEVALLSIKTWGCRSKSGEVNARWSSGDEDDEVVVSVSCMSDQVVELLSG